jgi:hypothetical protein
VTRDFDSIEFAPSGRGPKIVVNGQALVERVREVERPFAEREGAPDIAGGYMPLPAASLLANLTGRPAPVFVYGRKVTLLVCNCGCEGCWEFVAEVERRDDEVVWRGFEQVHRPLSDPDRAWHYDDLGELVFRRSDYDAALGRLAAAASR